MTTNIKIGDRVTRDTTNRFEDRNMRRRGDVVEIDEAAGRVRVRWTEEGNGSLINEGRGLRTWVALTSLYKV